MKPNMRKKDRLSSLLYTAGGNLSLVLGLKLFLEENGIAAGGFSGIAIILNYLFPVNIGVFTLLLTLPFLVWSYFLRGKRFTLLTAVSSLAFSLFAEALDFLPLLTEDLLLASLCGGLLYGLSAYLFLRGSASSGGTDLVARLLLHYRRELSLGTMLLIIDGIVVLASVFVSGNPELGVYAVVSLAACSAAADILVRSANKANLFFIITKHPQKLADGILFELGRGATCLDGTGMYSRHLGENGALHILFAVVKPREVWRLEALVQRLDPEAFTVHCPANGIAGEGFSRITPGKA